MIETTRLGTLVGGSIADGWRAFKRHPGLLISAIALFAIIEGVYGVMHYARFELGMTSYALWQYLWFGLTYPISAGVGYLALKLVRGDEASIRTMFAGYARYLPLAGAGVFVYVMYILGFLMYMNFMYLVALGLQRLDLPDFLLIVAAIAASCLVIGAVLITHFGLMQAPMLVVDKGLGPIEAVKGSWAMMSGYKLDAFLLGLASLAIIALGILALGVGLLVAVPVVLAAYAAFYNRVLAANPPAQLDLLPPADPLLAV